MIADDNIVESTAIQKVELLGGKVARDETSPHRQVTAISFAQGSPSDNNKFNDKYLHLLSSIPHLTSLDLANSPITDDGLKEITGLKNLTTLKL